MSDEPTDAEIDGVLHRINALANAGLRGHPQLPRALEILDAGGHLFCKCDGEQLTFSVGWFADPAMRPAEADPDETVLVMRLPRGVILGAPDAGMN